VLLIKNSPSWQGLNDALDEICSFEIPTERFCCREAVVRSGAVQLIVTTMLAGGWEGQRRKRTHRDPPPHDRDEMAAKVLFHSYSRIVVIVLNSEFQLCFLAGSKLARSIVRSTADRRFTTSQSVARAQTERSSSSSS
jgi:hypothetical protein